MSLNSLKKMIIFSSQSNRTLIEKYVEDVAEVERRSASSVIENALLATIFTGCDDVDFWISGLYCNGERIESVLRTIFEWMESGVSAKPKYDNLLPVLEFAIKENHCHNPIITGDEMILPHLYSQIRSLVEKLDEEADKENDLINRNILKNESDWIQKMLDNAIKCPESLHVSSFLYALKKNWDILKNCNITYRVLADLMSLCKEWRNGANARLELIEILRKISGEWMYE